MLSRNQFEYLQRIGVDIYIDRSSRKLTEKITTKQSSTHVSENPVTDQDAFNLLRKQVSVCTKCILHETRTQTVFGEGSSHADWLVIGEAPGAEEDRQGKPFVGRAGKLLNSMLFAMGMQRELVFIANILKCRPPSNRDPRPEEVAACETYLKKQIELINPKIILAVGRVAAQNLLKIQTPIGKMRGQRYTYSEKNIPVFVTYHPAYLLRSPREKRKVWEDLKLAMKQYREME